MRSAFLCFIFGLAGSLAACGGDDDSAQTSGSKACGGDPAGTWRISSIDLEEPSSVIAWIATEPACEGAANFAPARASGSYFFGFDKTYQAHVIVEIGVNLVIDSECMQALRTGCNLLQADLMATPNFTSAYCSEDNATSCTCSALSELRIDAESNYEVRGGQIMLGTKFGEFCVHDDQLELEVDLGPTGGKIVAERR